MYISYEHMSMNTIIYYLCTYCHIYSVYIYRSLCVIVYIDIILEIQLPIHTNVYIYMYK